MREKVFAIGDDFWIENDAGERAFKIDGKALRIRDTLGVGGRFRRRAVLDSGEEVARAGHHGYLTGWPYGRDGEKGADHATP